MYGLRSRRAEGIDDDEPQTDKDCESTTQHDVQLVSAAGQGNLVPYYVVGLCRDNGNFYL